MYDANRAAAVKYTAAQYGCSEAYVRSILAGTRKGGRSEELRMVYNDKYKALQKLLTPRP